MQTRVELALARGFAVAIDTAGEPLEFRGGELRATVNRLVDPTLTGGFPQVAGLNSDLADSRPEASIISFKLDAVTAAPKAGEQFRDSTGAYHRIQAVKRLPVCWQVQCEVSQAP